MSGRINGSALVARRFSVAPIVALIFLSPCAAAASQGDGMVHQSMWGLENMWNFGGLGVGAAIFLALALIWTNSALAQEHRDGDGWTDAKSLAQVLGGKNALGGQDVPVLIDVREPDEFVGPLGHIKGAVNVPLNGLTSNPASTGVV